MGGIFDSATRHAIAEIMLTHAQESKYGYVIPKESFEDLVEDVLRFFKASRDLKERGDKMIMGGATTVATAPAMRPVRR